MMNRRTAKVAVSLPVALFRSVEHARRELRLARSTAVAEALQAWLRQREEVERVRQYVEGYRRHPESKAEAQGWTRVAASTLRTDAW